MLNKNETDHNKYQGRTLKLFTNKNLEIYSI